MVDQILVGVVDDHPMFREGVVLTIARNPRMTVVAEGSSADDACRIVAQEGLHILLFDICIPNGGQDIKRVILTARTGVRVVVLTGSDSEEDLSHAIRAGAAGYILKGVTGNQLLQAIERIYHGEPYITPSLASRVLMMSKVAPLIVRSANVVEDKGLELTPREKEVLAHIAQGMTNSEIAAKLGLSISSTKHNIADLFRKMGVRSRLEAVHVAHKLKLA